MKPADDVNVEALSALLRGELPAERIERLTGVEIFECGALSLPSGACIVADPMYLADEQTPLEPRVRPGNYPVRLILAAFEFAHGSDRSVALTQLSLSDNPIVEWRYTAPANGEENDDYAWAFGVDGGMAALCDEAALSQVRAALMQHDYFSADANKNRFENVSWANVALDCNHNIVVFSTGDGDGAFPVLAGFDAQGELAAFVIDFGLFDPET